MTTIADDNTPYKRLVEQAAASVPDAVANGQNLFIDSSDHKVKRKDEAGDVTQVEGGAGGDIDAIHDNVSGEINAITEKTTLVAADLFLIEDSEASNAKKKAQYGNLAKFTDYSATSMVSGWAATPTVLMWVIKIGRLVFVNVNITGTSNAASVSFTTPYNLNSTLSVLIPCYVVDNNAAQAAPGRVRSGGLGTATFNIDKTLAASNGFTASGTKTVQASFFYMTD